MTVDLNELSRRIIEGDADKAIELTKAALEGGVPVQEILTRGLVGAMNTVGERFKRGEYFLPEMLLAGEAVKAAVEQLKPALIRGEAGYTGKYLIGTVQGDVHDIGKNIVAMMLEGNGWEVTDLGVDVAPEDFCSAVDKNGYHIVGMSALLTLTMSNLAKTIDALKAAGLRDRVKIMVGGAPVTQAYADQIGADGYAPDAVEAVMVAAKLLGKS
ncbi:MAG TPA: cobalamin-binding protein [Dehalococcoidia bacterium]|jgi:5-methyltetrahydrofolate--homocysteine methyltransferase|nr:cobalamin-binding protein [Dehalococcoidia bacterium]